MSILQSRYDCRIIRSIIATDRKTISLKSVIFWIGYFNIHKSLNIKWRVRFVGDGDQFSEAKEYSISPGLYNIDCIIDILERNLPWLKIALDKSRGEIIFHVPEMYEIKLPNELIISLKLPRGWFGDGEYSMSFIFIAIKSRLPIIYLMVDHLRYPIPVSDKSYGESAYVEYPNPSEKNLVARCHQRTNFQDSRF